MHTFALALGATQTYMYLGKLGDVGLDWVVEDAQARSPWSSAAISTLISASTQVGRLQPKWTCRWRKA